jgi:hypothetical protein
MFQRLWNSASPRPASGLNKASRRFLNSAKRVELWGGGFQYSAKSTRADDVARQTTSESVDPTHSEISPDKR